MFVGDFNESLSS